MAKRFIDRYVPGQVIPDDAYDKETLDQMIANKQVEKVEGAPPNA